jgi:hypothetical protein
VSERRRGDGRQANSGVIPAQAGNQYAVDLNVRQGANTEYQMSEAMTSQFVIAGLDPAIHRTEEKPLISMDAWVKPVHDELLILGFGITTRITGCSAFAEHDAESGVPPKMAIVG